MSTSIPCPWTLNEAYVNLASHIGDDPARRAELNAWRQQLRLQIDRSRYLRPALAWQRTVFSEAVLCVYDRRFLDPASGRIRMTEFLLEGECEFGGYDVVLLWHSYPRLGLDGRNQFDLLRELPGGLPALATAVDEAHQRGVKVYTCFTAWDVGTRAEGRPAHLVMVELTRSIGADGIYIEGTPQEIATLIETIEREAPDLVVDLEMGPAPADLGRVTSSWMQKYPGDPVIPPKLPLNRWLEPRFSGRGIERETAHPGIVAQRYFFNGCGMIIWEHIFGWWNPWPVADRLVWRRCLALLRRYAEAFQDPDWQPLIGTLVPGVYANRWRGGDYVLYTLLNTTDQPVDAAVLTIAAGAESTIYDVWHDQRIEPDQGRIRLRLPAHGAGCVLMQPAAAPPPPALPVIHLADLGFRRRTTAAAHLPRPVEPTRPRPAGQDPGDQCFIPGGRFVMEVRHNTAPIFEGACYDYQGDQHDKGHPSRHCWLRPYWIDRTEVTNASFLEFLRQTHFTPGVLASFLNHWQRPAGAEAEPWRWIFPAHLADHPVVFVDLDDARAYAHWAGKRLPTEEEWQFAAQGPQGRLWPWSDDPDDHHRRLHWVLDDWKIKPTCYQSWGNAADPQRCNTASQGTTSVDRYPQGASPFGVLDLCGNVWEWTESQRDDGHTRYAMLRGGSFRIVSGPAWYPTSDAQPADVHEKMLLIHPGLDRCDNVGFRCVQDAG